MKLLPVVTQILRGYLRKGRSIFIFLLFIFAAMAIGGAIVYPLWKFSTSHPELYTKTILILGGLGTVVYIMFRIRNKRKYQDLPAQNTGTTGRKTGLLKLGKILLSLVCIYIQIIQIAAEAWLRALILFIFFFFLLGWIFFGNTSDQNRTT